MQKASILTAIALVLSVFLASGAYAQSRGMDRMSSNSQYQSRQSDSFNVSPDSDTYYMERNTNRYYEGAAPPPASFPDRGMAVERGRFYYEPQMPPQGFSNAPPDVLTFESTVPPPTASDIRSEQINRKHDRPAQVYVERQQGIPTSIAPEGTRRAMRGERPAARGYYPQSGQQGQRDLDQSY